MSARKPKWKQTIPLIALFFAILVLATKPPAPETRTSSSPEIRSFALLPQYIAQ